MSDYKSGRVVVLGLLLLAVALGVIAKLGQPRFVLGPRLPAKPSVLAVLAFENLSGDADLELLASDLTAAIAESLEGGRFELLLGDSAWVYTGSEHGIEQIADELGADYVVAGSVDQKDGEVAVDAYLFRAGVEQGFWAERMSWSDSERESIADDVARRIGDALRY